MDIVLAQQVAPEKLDKFLTANPDIEQETLYESGYVAQVNDEIIGCFILDTLHENKYWLKQLYITKSHATALPVLLESILVIAKNREAKEVYVHSHQALVDILLEALQFNPHTDDMLLNKRDETKGKWWAYQVS